MESRIRKIFLAESGILGSRIRNTVQGIPMPLTSGIEIPSSTGKELGIQYLVKVMDSEFFASGTWNLELNPE